jgi:hypothetical protein
MIDFILYAIVAVTIASISYVAIGLKIRNRRLANQVIQLTIDKDLLIKHVESMSKADDSDVIEKTEGFLAFISQSRDWAFSYIEEVQEGLKAYAEIVGPQIEYHKTYGQVIESPHMIILDRIADAYPIIEKLLPKDSPNK